MVHTDDGAKKTDFPYAVVLSRDCKALRSKDILVAGIKPCQTGEIVNALKREGFETFKAAFSKIRDGDGTPDSCYIGPIEENVPKRFAIQLDAIFTVRVVGPREEWIQGKRVMSLSFSMVRHLQSRLFASFTRQGFDDVSWWPTKDLELAVNQGEEELLQLQTKLQAAKSQELKAQVNGHASDSKLSRLRDNLDELEGKIAPYRQEFARRKEDVKG